MENNGYYPHKILNRGNLLYKNDSSQLEIIIKLFMYCPDFAKFSEEYGPENYDLPHILVGKLIDYLITLHSLGEENNIFKILIFLDELSYNDNYSIKDLLLTGILEAFSRQKEILPELVQMMPENLKKVFLENFSHYLQ